MSAAHRVLERLGLGDAPAIWRAVAQAVAVAAMATPIAIVLSPWFRDTSTFGFHDWDSQTAHRYLVRLSLLRYGEMPWWNPYACGGFPAWGYVEGDTIVASPWLPVYLLLPMSLALRVEVLGMAVLGAAGAYALAGRFTASHAARALVAALWAVNGRWGLQTASGHTWHLAYAWMPWCLSFYDRCREHPSAAGTPLPGAARVRDLALAGLSLAMLVYAGGIYPLPHTVLALAIYAGAVCVLERSARPLVTLALCGAISIGLAAPKLVPLLDTFGKAPRLIDSNETMDLGALLTMLTSRDQAFYSRPARVSPYGWHEWGIYIGAAGVIVLLLGVVLVGGRREAALKLAGVAFVALGFGAFHPRAPWTLLHAHVPVFRSQHVPSRFLYPAVLLLALVAAAGLGRLLTRASLRRPWLDAAAAVFVLAIGVDVARVAQKPMANAMWMVPPPIPSGRPFHFEKEPPFHYKRRDWAGPMYLAMLGNTGVLNCYGTPPFERKGARATKDPAYRGEVHVVPAAARAASGAAASGGPAPEGTGTAGVAKLVSWSPNAAVVEVSAAEAGALLVYNMNYDEGWLATIEHGGSSERAPAVAHEHAVAVRLPPGDSRVTFRYRPPGLALGVLVGAATAAGLAIAWRRQARIDRGQA